MTHQLLPHTKRTTDFAQERAIHVSEGVPSKLSDTDRFTFWLENLPLDDAGTVTASREVGREYEPLCAVTLPLEPDVSNCEVRRQIILGRFGTFEISPELENRSGNPDLKQEKRQLDSSRRSRPTGAFSLLLLISSTAQSYGLGRGASIISYAELCSNRSHRVWSERHIH